MQNKTLRLAGIAGLTLIPVLAMADSSSQELEKLRAENARLAAELAKAKGEITDLQSAPTSKTREMNMPLPILPPVSQEQAKADAASAASGEWWKDFRFAVGTKVWLTEWNTWYTPASTSGGKTKNLMYLTSDSNTALNPIPSISMRYKDMFVTASYTAETDYDFNQQSDMVSFKGTPLTTDMRLSGRRKEWDVTLGYQILPYLALTAGYKEISQHLKQESCTFMTAAGGAESCGAGQFDFDVTYAGPTVGISGAAPIGHGFGLYGNFAYGWLAANYRDSVGGNHDDAVNDTDYYVGELGFTYSHALKEMPVYMPLSAATAYAGYRYQTYESEISKEIANGNKGKDTVQGFVTGVNLSF